jgi:hypothetical protein
MAMAVTRLLGVGPKIPGRNESSYGEGEMVCEAWVVERAVTGGLLILALSALFFLLAKHRVPDRLGL